MATKTTNYGLEKPDGTDFYDVDVQNSNMDIIDKQMKANANAITQLNSDKVDKADKANVKWIITGIEQLNSERAFLSKVFSGTSNKMIYWQRCQSEIAKALGMQISDINNEKLYIAACNGDWNAYQGLVTGAALQWDNTNLNINIGLSSDTNGAVRINFMIYRKLN